MSEVFKNSALKILVVAFLLMQNGLLLASSIVVDSSTSLIDGSQQPYNKLIPGDTIYLKAGPRDYLLIRNFQGNASKPFVFINKGGVVTIDTNHTYGISIQNCRYFRFTGTGVQANFYGIEVKRVANGSGLGIGGMSSDFEIDHVSIRDVPIGGLYAKTDPDCNLNTTREKFTQFNTIIHDNYIENAGNEGMYVGSTKYSGQIVKCNGKDTLLMPSLLDGVKVYNNIIKYSGWDGIQVSSAYKSCQVYDNIVLFDSQAEYVNQMSGIILGGGSDCDCYNNYIADGKGDGIENHGLGGKKIFNNIIVNAGITYAPNETGTTKMKHGIFVSDISALPDRSFYIINNTIINPKSDGIRFANAKSKNNLISSNVIISPGNFDTYEFGNTQFKGVDSYIMIPDKSTSILLKNNYLARNALNSGLDFDYSLLKNSPLINGGYAGQPFISFDFKYHPRTSDNPPDIGAYEYYNLLDVSKPLKDQTLPIAYPNPVKLELIVKFMIDAKSDVTISLYNLVGRQMMVKEQFGVIPGTYSTKIDVQDLSPGLYLYSVKTINKIESGKFIKVE